MFTQFRIRYPQGSLVSKLVCVDRGQYIVRAAIKNEGVTLATGLAAANTIEQAEDKAWQRAILALGIDLNAAIEDEQSRASQDLRISRGKKSPQISGQKGNAPLNGTEKPLLTNRHNSETHVVASKPLSNQLPFEKLPEPSELKPPSSELTEVTTDLPVEPPAQIRNRSDYPSETPLSQPQDLSDIIIKTDIELKRLLWTKEQGREYLLQTYGKRSRQHLTQGELLEFLNYLQTQASP
ncbi:MAG: hypothetical protein F6K24_43370 [Okeania sp. SIO2D1]|nr:hypothetical protein [Okeania sp. SIO2D1]